jgi:TolB protein
MTKSCVALTVALVAVFFVPPVEGRVILDINEPTFVQVPLVLPKWKAIDRTPSEVMKEVYKTLYNDLVLSGFFRVIDYQTLRSDLQGREGIPETRSLPDWEATGADYLVAGEALLVPETMGLRLKVALFDLVENRFISERRREGTTKNLREVVHRLSDDVIQDLTRERGVNTTKIAFVVESAVGGKEIFVADFDGGNVRAVTQNQSINIAPAWSPDGRIAFTSYLKRNPDLYLIHPDGNPQSLQRFSFYPGVNASPSWSPDGKQIALMMGKEGKSEIFLLNADGTDPRKLTKGHGNEASPRWSPDGKSIVFVSDRSGSPQLYIMRSDGSEVRRLTYEGSYNTHPSWSPKGDRIAYCGREGGRLQIMTIRPDGSERQVLTSGSGDNESPCWSPDGRYIAFSSNRAGGSRIYIMNGNGSNQRRLTQNSRGGEWAPAWSKRFD